MVCKDRPCKRCGLWTSKLNLCNLCGECEIKFRIERNLEAQRVKQVKRAKEMPVIIRKTFNKEQKFSIWFSEPRIRDLFKTEIGFARWLKQNEGRFEGIEQLIKYRNFCLKLVSKNKVK